MKVNFERRTAAVRHRALGIVEVADGIHLASRATAAGSRPGLQSESQRRRPQAAFQFRSEIPKTRLFSQRDAAQAPNAPKAIPTAASRMACVPAQRRIAERCAPRARRTAISFCRTRTQ